MASTWAKPKNASNLDLVFFPVDALDKPQVPIPHCILNVRTFHTDDPVQHVVEVQLVHRNLFNVRKEVRRLRGLGYQASLQYKTNYPVKLLSL